MFCWSLFVLFSFIHCSVCYSNYGLGLSLWHVNNKTVYDHSIDMYSGTDPFFKLKFLSCLCFSPQLIYIRLMSKLTERYNKNFIFWKGKVLSQRTCGSQLWRSFVWFVIMYNSISNTYPRFHVSNEFRLSFITNLNEYRWKFIKDVTCFDNADFVIYKKITGQKINTKRRKLNFRLV